MKKRKEWWHQATPVKAKGYTEDAAKGEMRGALRLLDQAAHQLFDTHRKLMALPGYRRVRADKSEESDSLAWSLAGACTTTFYDLFGEHVPSIRKDLRDTEASVARRNRARLASQRRHEREEARKLRVRGKLKANLLKLADQVDAQAAALRESLRGYQAAAGPRKAA